MELECLGLSLDLDVPLEATAGDWVQPAAGTVGLLQQHPRQTEINTQGVSAYSHIGRRKENLDQMDCLLTDEWQLLAVYDGHGQAAVSNYLKCNLLTKLGAHPLLRTDFSQAVRQTFEEVENQIAKDPFLMATNSGSTALIALVTEQSVFFANLGDSRALLVSDTGCYLQATNEHNLLNELEREAVSQRGGIILKRGKQYRLNGEINLSRSFGDQSLKPSLSSTPEVIELSRQHFKYIVLATDGFWQCTTNQQTADLLQLNSWGTGGLARRLYNGCNQRPSDNATILCFELP